MNNTNLTLPEQERIAYINGDVQLANAIAGQIDDQSTADNALDAGLHVQDAIASIPNEDFLQNFIDKLRIMSKSRVTKEDVAEFAIELEQFQQEMAHTFEYIQNELKEARDLLP